AAHKQLTAQVAKGSASRAEDLRSGLIALLGFGIAQCVPVVAVGDDAAARDALLRQASAALKESTERLEYGAVLRSAPVATDPPARCDQLLERARAAFGTAFAMLPGFTLDAVGAAELGSALAASTTAQGGDALAAHGWFTRCARVRRPLARLGA